MYQCSKCNSQSIVSYNSYDYFDFFECANCKYIFKKSILDKNLNICCRNPFPIIVIDYFFYPNNKPALFNQCLNCGGAFKIKKYKFETHSDLIESEYNESSFNKWKEDISRENSFLEEQFDFFNKSRFYKYYLYLASYKWKFIRDKVIERDKGICLHCKSAPATEVHHKHYDTIFNEKLEDLESVCSPCHRRIHNKPIYKA